MSEAKLLHALSARSIHPVSAEATIAVLRAQVAAQAELIQRQETELVHSRKIFSRASEAARIGVWECSLPDETLTWTDVVYDLFDLPRGAPLDRKATVECYPPESRAEMSRRRSHAIATLGGFEFDAEIITFKGRRRFIRITASVESEGGVPVRIFGMKQDITEEKLLADRNRFLASFDVLTGLANRSRFQERLAEGTVGTLMLVDLDGFKEINDTFGHAFGDECLSKVGKRLASACENADLVARIGGDEFAVLFAGEDGRVLAGEMAGKMIEAVFGVIHCGGHSVTIGASIGIAHSEGCTAADLFARADVALYAAKAAGRSTYRFYEPSLDSRLAPRRLIVPGEGFAMDQAEERRPA